jgi:hypothetical protein
MLLVLLLLLLLLLMLLMLLLLLLLKRAACQRAALSGLAVHDSSSLRKSIAAHSSRSAALSLKH